jgi:hypothetical protein
VIGLQGDDGSSPIYNWFTDIPDPYGSAFRADHDAGPSRIQDLMRRGMHVLGRSALFRVIVYVVLSLVLLPFCRRDRIALVFLLSGLASEGILFLIAPTTDWRYSCWMIVAVAIAVAMLVAKRAQSVWTTASSKKQ